MPVCFRERKNVPQRLDFYRDYVPEPEFDIRNLMPDTLPKGKRFETESDADEERWIRVEILDKGSSKDRHLAKLMDACSPNSPCNLGSCPNCMCPTRIYRIGQTLRVFSVFNRVIPITLFFEMDNVPFGDLDTFSWDTIKDRLRQQLRRKLGKRAVVMGGLEVSADYTRKLWTPHAHLFVANCSHEKIEALRELYEPDTDKSRKMKKMRKVKRKNRPFQMSYAHKFMALYRPFKQRGKKRPKAVRLPIREHNEHMHYLASIRPLDSLFVYNITRKNGLHYKLNITLKKRNRCTWLNCKLWNKNHIITL